MKLQTCGLTAFPKETPSQMLFYENNEVLQKVIFTEHCCATASDFLNIFNLSLVLSAISLFIVKLPRTFRKE